MIPVKILIVEDERIVARDIQSRLTRLGYAVVGVTRFGEEAVRLADELRPDLVLMDIRLEGAMDGVTAAQEIRDRWELPIVYMTAYADDETLARARVTEPFGYILKPFEERELRTAIEMALYKHQAERKLRESERRYAVTLSSIGDAVIATDDRAQIGFLNPVAAALTGWSQQEAVGKPLDEVFRVINEQTRQKAENPAVKVLRQGIVIGLANHTSLLARDGREIPIEDCGAPIIDDKGAVAGAVLVFHDVTERRRSEKALILFRALLDRTNDGIEVVDPATGRFLDVNEKVCLAHGYTRAEYLTLGVTDVEETIPDWSSFTPQLDELRRLGSLIYEGRHRRKDGSTFPVEVNVNYVHLDREYLVAVVRDTSERKRAEETLRQAEEKYRSIFDNAIEGIFQSTPQGRFVTANPALARMLGYSGPDELVNAITDVAGQLYVDAGRRAVFTRLVEERGWVQGFECQLYRKDGSKIWVSLSTRVARDAQGRPLFYEGTVEEITERKRLEEQFLQAQKMEAVGQLAAGVAHDFNNLLTAISGYSEMALAQLHRGDPLAEPIAAIQKAGERAATLTRQLLVFSRKQILQPQLTDLGALVKELAKMLQRLIGEDIELAVVSEPGLGLVEVDPSQFEQVVMNLAVNARDAMPRGGKLTIETRNVELDAACSQTDPGVTPERYVLLVVRDTGHGMDEATRARIFEPFFTTKEVGRGTGLGLAVVHGVVRQSGGHIEVSSAAGHGTTLTIYIPRVEGVAAPRKSAQGLPPSPKGTETVLLVDDDDAVRELAGTALRCNGYVVLEARHGEEALRVGRGHPGPIHLLLTDVVMPRMNGRQLADRLAAERPELRILFVSGYTAETTGRHGVLEGKEDYLSKPFSPTMLAAKVREVLDAGRSSSQGSR
jgi:PAS domain S-box-containing protein